MQRHNIFLGNKDYFSKYAKSTYNKLMSREWITYTDVMIDANRGKELDCSISCCDGYGELKKAFPAVCKAIEQVVGPNCIEIEGNKRNRRFRYIGKEDKPLSEMLNAAIISNIKEYWHFCQDSAGFFPNSWLQHFFKGTSDLLEINRRKRRGEQMIFSSVDRDLSNIEYLPQLYEIIRDKQVLKVDYKPYDEEIETIIFHPHLLKEFNGRWFLFGHAEGKEPEFGYNLALDRIENFDLGKSIEQNYIYAPKGFYAEFFKNIVGVSHKPDDKPATIIIRATTHNIYKLTETKKIHHSQRTIKPFGQYEDGEYGEFELYVEPNNEFIGRILQMGDGFVVVSPVEIRELFRKRVKKMADLYKD